MGRRVAMLALALMVVVGATACGGSDGSQRGSAKPQPGTQAAPTNDACPSDGEPVRDIAYESIGGVDANLLSVDVYPTTVACPAPVVVWVHGGGWRIGDKSNQIADKQQLFNGLGYTLVSVNYRLTDPSAADPVRYPTHNEDVAAALAWVHEHIAEYGGNPDRIALLGHSAGAQIVASIATDERYLAAHGLGLDTVSCVAPLDTEGFDVRLQGRYGTQIYLDAFGTDPAVWGDASPITHVAPGKQIPSHLLVRRGTAGRQRLLALYEAALTQAGVPFATIDAVGLTHGDVNNRIGALSDTTMTPAVTSFLTECFG